MINPEEKLKAFLSNRLYINELRERLIEATEEDEKQYLQEEIEKTLIAMKQDIKDGNLAVAKQNEIGEAEFESEFYQCLVDRFGAEQAQELYKEAGQDINRLYKTLASVFMQDPDLRHIAEERGINLEEIIRLNSN